MTFTHNPILAKVKFDPHAKNQEHRSNGSAVREQTDKRADGRYQVQYPPASQSYAVDKYVWSSTWICIMDILSDFRARITYSMKDIKFVELSDQVLSPPSTLKWNESSLFLIRCAWEN